MTRTCANPECNKPLERKDRETRGTFQRRRYCNARCVSDGRSYAQRTKRGECVVCGKETIPFRRPCGWRISKTCRSKECLTAARLMARRGKRCTPPESDTWAAPDGTSYTLPTDATVRREFKRVMTRRAKATLQLREQVRPIVEAPVTDREAMDVTSPKVRRVA